MTSLQWLDSLQGSGIRPGLGRMRALLKALGNPHRAYPSIIVAGTNGKGSTSATLTSIFIEAGYRTGHYTSPHLVDMRERWTVNGEMIDATLLEECIEEIRAIREVRPSYFEALTLIGFLAFAKMKCEMAVLEVGMGGRLDATNVVKPVAAIIAPVGFDHTDYLGNTLRKIAKEKAGVIHRGAIVLTSNDDPAVLSVLRKRAQTFGNRFIHVTEEHDTPLAGEFQRRNAGLAVRAARELKISEDAIERGVANTKWRGRLERMQAGGKTIWIDGGHNAHAARAIAPFLDANVTKPRALVFGIMSDKDVDAVKETLWPLFDRVITTEPYPPRSMKAEDLGGIAIPDMDQAFETALQSPEPSIVVAGSLYLAGAAIAFFDKIRGL